MEKPRTNWLTVPEASDYLRCGERILREFVTNKKIPHVVFAGKALFHPSRLDEWLLEQEQPCKPRIVDSQKDAELSEDARRIKPDCPRDEVDSVIKELIQYKDGNERFVNGLGKNLRKDLMDLDYRLLSQKVFAQLSRWCHPRKTSHRNDWTQEIAQNISMLMFGKVIDRVSHPSYRS